MALASALINITYSTRQKSKVEFNFDSANYLVNTIITGRKFEKLGLLLKDELKTLLDNVLLGDSYFTAEIKSLKRIVDDIKQDNESYYFIDEILKGTNTLERIAASASIIDFFVKNKSLAFIATHDIKLTEIFKDRADNIHFRESFDENCGLVFDYKLYSGRSSTKSAIKLLGIMDFPNEVVEKANRNIKYFEDNKSWA